MRWRDKSSISGISKNKFGVPSRPQRPWMDGALTSHPYKYHIYTKIKRFFFVICIVLHNINKVKASYNTYKRAELAQN